MTKEKTTPSASGDRSPLGRGRIVAFVATSDPSRARIFYRGILGLRLVSEDAFALVFEVEGTTLRVAVVPSVARAEYTVLGFEVADAAAAARALQAAGVALERYAGMQQDDLGIWTSPGGAKVAWFKDPDGNTLSISQQ